MLGDCSGTTSDVAVLVVSYVGGHYKRIGCLGLIFGSRIAEVGPEGVSYSWSTADIWKECWKHLDKTKRTIRLG